MSCILNDNSLLPEFIEQTNEKFFNYYRSEYKWIRKKARKNEKVSVVRMKQDNLRVKQIIDCTFFMTEFKDYLKLLQENYVKNQLKKAADYIYNITKESIPIEKLKSKAQEEIFKVTLDTEHNTQESDLESALYKSYNTLNEERESGQTKGLKTGIPSFDAKTGGFIKGHLSLLAGSTSMGKTAFALKITQNIIKNNYKVGFISLEMDDTELVDRLIIMDSRVNANDFNNRIFSDEQYKNINAAYNRYHNYKDNCKISYKRGLTIDQIKARCRRYYKEMKGLDLIIIDYLQRVKLPGKNINKETATAANEIRDLAGELDVPILLLSQLNRRAEGKRPRLHHLRDSGELEESADEVFFVYRPSYSKNIGEQEKEKIQKGEIIQAKGRTSGVGIVKMRFYTQIQYWQDNYLYNKEGEISVR